MEEPVKDSSKKKIVFIAGGAFCVLAIAGIIVAIVVSTGGESTSGSGSSSGAGSGGSGSGSGGAEWGDWAEWGEGCVGGIQERLRACKSGGEEVMVHHCPGADWQQQFCTDQGALPVDGNWDEWGEFSQCTQTCGNEQKVKRKWS